MRMRMRRRAAAILLLVASMLAVQGCGGSAKNVSIRGIIQNVADLANGEGKSILVEGRQEPDTSHDKASVRVSKTAKIYKMANGKKQRASGADLQKGQLVEVVFDGPVALSYPVQATAGEIVILESGAGS